MAPLITGDAQCQWAAWFRAHYSYDKVPRDGDLTTWKINHAEMLEKRVVELKAAGWECLVENANSFKLKGRTVTLAGCPDIVAMKIVDDVRTIKVIDCKSGQRRESDVAQVWLYLLALPKVLAPLLLAAPHIFEGEIQYKDGCLAVPMATFENERKRISGIIAASGAAVAPARSPSAKECAFCDITKEDCPDRMEEAASATTSEF